MEETLQAWDSWQRRVAAKRRGGQARHLIRRCTILTIFSCAPPSHGDSTNHKAVFATRSAHPSIAAIAGKGAAGFC